MKNKLNDYFENLKGEAWKSVKREKKVFLLPNLRSIDHKGCPMMNGTSKASCKSESEFGCRVSFEEFDNTTYTLKCAMHAQPLF